MKRNSLSWLWVVLVPGAIATYVLAQQVATNGTSGRLADAITLINAGQFQQARENIATIPQRDPQYAPAQCYDALCLYQMTNLLDFYNAMKSPVIRQASIAPAVRQDLDFKQIDVLFYFRKFDEALPCIASFQRNNLGSPQLNAVAEYRLASLFERGMKKTQEACLTKDTNVFNRRWVEGKANLEEFLGLAGSFQGTNYSAIRKRELKQDVWTARLTLGDERAVLDEIPAQDTGAREKASLLRVQLYQKLQPENTDRNLQMLGDFFKDFPDSNQRKRVEFDMAGLNFHRGKELCAEADAAEKAGDSKGATEKRAAARSYFATQRMLQGQAVVDKAAGIEAADILDLREDLLYSYALEKDYAMLSSLTSSIIADSTPGDLNWMMAKSYAGALLANQNPPRTNEAVAIFDDLLKLGFNGRPEHDRKLVTAARWRVNLALKASDLAGARQVIQLVQDGACPGNLKADFLKDHATYVAGKSTDSK